MQFTVEQIRSVRNNFLEPPYPGFSLDEIFNRRRSTQTKLTRGPNAWCAKGNAQTTEEWVARLVQGSLNKLSESNYDIMLDKLRTRELFSTPDIRNSVVELIFRKALDEPEHSKLYARICFGLAMYEVSLNEPGTRPKSELRNAIVYTAQNEFRQFKSDETICKNEKLDEEEKEYAVSQFMRRKRANMRFVGQLFLNDVLSHATMLIIINITMKEAVDGGFPASENIELLAELLSTVGQRLDQHNKKDLDYHFNLLSNLIKRSNNPYPHRIRFKIMDLIDLRKLEWGTKPKVSKVKKTFSNNVKDTNRQSPSSPTSWKSANKGSFSANASNINTDKTATMNSCKSCSSGEEYDLAKRREKNMQPSAAMTQQEQLSNVESAAVAKRVSQRESNTATLANEHMTRENALKQEKRYFINKQHEQHNRSKSSNDNCDENNNKKKGEEEQEEKEVDEEEQREVQREEQEDAEGSRSISHSPVRTRPASPAVAESVDASMPTVANKLIHNKHYAEKDIEKLNDREWVCSEPTSPLSPTELEILPRANKTDDTSGKTRFDLRVRSMFEQWVNDRNNDFIPQWIDEFNDCDQIFSSAEELCSAVAMEIIREACVTTRKDAQREAYSFLIVGLFLTDEEVLNGFAGALAAAVEDGLMEDVPKFSERFMHMLRLTSTEEETNADVYYDAANVLRMAFNKLEYVDDTTIPLMMSSFWSKVPKPNLEVSEEEQVRLGFQVLYSLCDTQGVKPGVEKLIASLIYAMSKLNITETGALQELLAYENDSAFYNAIKQEICLLMASDL